MRSMGTTSGCLPGGAAADNEHRSIHCSLLIALYLKPGFHVEKICRHFYTRGVMDAAELS
jgi:hypothetical protein